MKPFHTIYAAISYAEDEASGPFSIVIVQVSRFRGSEALCRIGTTLCNTARKDAPPTWRRGEIVNLGPWTSSRRATR
jgi:hypothetical protein